MKTVIFDAGGVLFRNGVVDAYLDALCASSPRAGDAAAGLCRLDVSKEWARIKADFWCGHISIREAEVSLARVAGCPVIPWRPKLTPTPMASMALAVPAYTAVLSNHRDEWLRPALSRLITRNKPRRFISTIVSSNEGIAKPDPRLYRLAQRRLQWPDPGDIVFVDDKQENLDAAAKLGWTTVLAAGEWVDTLYGVAK